MKRKFDTLDTAEGNTCSSAKRRVRGRNWVFTWNNYPESWKNILTHLTPNKYVCQQETGSQGTPHIQGLLCFSNPIYFSSLHKQYPTIHWEKCKSLKASISYCSKQETRSGELIHKGFKLRVPVRDPIINARPWQRDILLMISQVPDDRKIVWIVDEQGGKGKTSLSKHICIKYDAILVGGRTQDILYGVSSYIAEHGNIQVVMINLARDQTSVNYSAIEQVKDGIFFSSKYESAMCLYNSPHVIIFSNRQPDRSKLSADRWQIIDLGVGGCPPNPP